MLLNLNQIQVLDYLLQITNFPKKKPENKLRLVVIINNCLWCGNFLNDNLTFTKSFHLDDFDFSIQYDTINVPSIIKRPDDLKFNSLKDLNSLYLLLDELINRINKMYLPELDLNPVLYNAINLDTNLSLPFLKLDPNIKYKVVSIIETSPNE